MSIRTITREAVLKAIAEFDALGREPFLRKYGFGQARDYVVVYEGKRYDSKAIAGVAYGFEHPLEGPLASNEFSAGRETVLPVLESLGFDIEAGGEETRGSNEKRVWLIRAGQAGQYEHLALEEGAAVIGWSELGELTPQMSREDLKQLLRARSGEERSQALARQAGQIHRFIHEVKPGDLVVLPLRTRPEYVAVGVITSPYHVSRRWTLCRYRWPQYTRHRMARARYPLRPI